MSEFVFLFSTGAALLALALGHGYIRDPAARNACGQYGFESCVMEWTMDEKNCGGFARQWDTNNGKCGVCGDPYDLANPILVEPGVYATGTITSTYQEGQVIDVKINITVSHRGWSEFRIGDIGTPPITQDKLAHLLRLADGSTRWQHSGVKGLYTIQLQLPQGLSCGQCVLQWWWKTANSWGCDVEGCGMGHGAQETFVNCADVAIIPSDGILPTNPQTTAPPATDAAGTIPAVTSAPATNAPSGGCNAIGSWQGNANMDAWCVSNCALGNCPSDMCQC